MTLPCILYTFLVYNMDKHNLDKNLDARDKRGICTSILCRQQVQQFNSTRSVWETLKEIRVPCLFLSVSQHHCKTEKSMSLIALASFCQDIAVIQLVPSVSWKCHSLVEWGLLIIRPDFLLLVSCHCSVWLYPTL